MIKWTSIAFVLIVFSFIVSAQENNVELTKLFEADQQERQQQQFTFYNDKDRREKVKKIIEDDGLNTSDDYFHAAIIFQHGNAPEDYKTAQKLASRSVALNPSNEHAKWLICATEDRYLLSTGKPQVWGTQYIRNGGKLEYQLPFDREAKTDGERKKMNVALLDDTQVDRESQSP